MNIPLACCRKDEGCEGVLQKEQWRSLPTEDHFSIAVYPCTVCGRVAKITQGEDGEVTVCGMYTQDGEEIYVIDGELVKKNKDD